MDCDDDVFLALDGEVGIFEVCTPPQEESGGGKIVTLLQLKGSAMLVNNLILIYLRMFNFNQQPSFCIVSVVQLVEN